MVGAHELVYKDYTEHCVLLFGLLGYQSQTVSLKERDRVDPCPNFFPLRCHTKGRFMLYEHSQCLRTAQPRPSKPSKPSDPQTLLTSASNRRPRPSIGHPGGKPHCLRAQNKSGASGWTNAFGITPTELHSSGHLRSVCPFL